MNRSGKITSLIVLIIAFSLMSTALFVATGVAAQGNDDSDVAVTSTQPTVSPGENTTVNFTIENVGSNETAVILDSETPEGWEIVNQTNEDSNATYKSINQTWLWQTLNTSETQNSSITLQVPSDFDENEFNISASAKVKNGSGLNITDQTTQTIPRASVNTTNIGFGTVAIANTSTEQVLIRNDASEPVNISGVTVTGQNESEFTANESTITGDLSPGKSELLNITFNATERSLSTADLQIDTNQTDLPPPNISLEGRSVVKTPLTVNNSNIAFGGVALSNSSSVQFNITNNASKPIRNVGLSISGDSEDEFEIGNSPDEISAKSNHTVTVTFDPVAQGTTSGTISMTAENQIGTDISPPDIELGGTGLVGTPLNITANRTTITEGDAIRFEVTDDEDNSINSTITVPGTSIETTTGTDGVVVFPISTVGTFDVTAANETAEEIDYTPDSVPITVRPPSVELNKSDIGFENVSIAQSSYEQFNISNPASVPVTIDAIEITGSDAGEFEIESTTPDEVTANETINLSYNPTSRGNATAVVEVDNKQIELSGNGVAPIINVTDADTEITANADQPTNGTLSITNDGNADLNATISVTDGDSFTPYPDRINIGPAETTTVDIEYAPDSDYPDGNTTGVDISHENTSAESVSFTVEGTVKNREIGFSQSSLNTWGGDRNVTVLEPIESSLFIENTGTTTEKLNATVNDTTNYSLAPEDTGNFTLDPGEDNRLSITANVTAAGVTRANLTVENATDSTLNTTTNINATARAPELDTTESIDFDDTSNESTTTTQFQVNNTGQADLSVDLNTALNDSESRNFSVVSSSQVTVSPGESQNITVGFTPQTTGTATANLSIDTNDPEISETNISLSGNSTETDLRIINESITYTATGITSGTTTETVVVENDGTEFTGSISLSPETVFTLTESEDVTIGEDETAAFDVAFSPTNRGEQTGTVTVNGSSGAGKITNASTALVGTGRTGQLSFGQQAIRTGVTETQSGTTGDISIENTGLAGTEITIDDISIDAVDSGTFSINTSEGIDPSNTPRLSGGQTGEVAVTFTPDQGASNGVVETSLTLNASGPGVTYNRTLPLQGTVSTPEPTASPTEIDAGTVQVNTPVNEIVSISNDGGEPFQVDSDSITTNDPAVDARLVGREEIVPGGQTTVAVQLNSSTTGDIDTTIDFQAASNSVSIPSVNITATVIAPSLSTASLTSVEFTDTATGSATRQDVTINNTGNASLSIASPDISGENQDAFSLITGNRSLRIAPNTARNISIGFSPQTAQGGQDEKQASLEIQPLNDPETGTQDITITGTALSADAELNESTVSFGEITQGQAEKKSLHVSNDGNTAFEITGRAITGSDSQAFSVDGLRTRVIGKDTTEVFEIEVNTTGENLDSLSGQLTIETNDSDVTSQLGAAVVAPNAEISQTIAESKFGTTKLGTTSTATLQVNNTGNSELTISDAVVEGPDSSAFSIIDQPENNSIPAQDSGEIELEFSPEDAPDAISRSQSRTGSLLEADAKLNITTNEPNPQDQVQLIDLNAEATTTNLDLPRTFEMGDTPIGETTTRNITIANTQSATAPISIDSVSLSGGDTNEYSVELTGADVLLPGEESTILVELTPSSFGQKFATLSMDTNSTRQPVRKIGISNTETTFSVTYGSVNVAYQNPSAQEGEPTVDVSQPLDGRNATLETVGADVTNSSTTALPDYSLNYTFKSTAPNQSLGSLEKDPQGNNATALRYINATTTDQRNMSESTFEVEVSKAVLASQNVSVENVTIYHENETATNNYEALDTKLQYETLQGYVYEVTTSDYSVFAVAGTPDSEFETEENGDDGSEDDGSEDDGNNDDGGGGGGGGAGGGAGGGGGGNAQDGPPSFEQIRSTLNLVPTESETSVDMVDQNPDDNRLTIEPTETDSVSRIHFNNQDLSGKTKITEYGEPPTTVKNDIKYSAANDINKVDVTTENNEVIDSNIDIISLTEIEPEASATEDQSATVELTVSKSAVKNPNQLRIIKEEYVFSEQKTKWVTVETTVTENSDRYVLEGNVNKFSLFAIAEVSDESIATTETTNDDSTGSGSNSPPLLIVSFVILVIAGIIAIIRIRR